LNETFRHQTVTGAQVEAYIGEHAGRDLSKVFDQYLRTTMIPVLEYRIEGETLSYRWANVVPGFDMPVGVTLSGGGYTVVQATEEWQSVRHTLADPSAFEVDANYYVETGRVEGG
jgi:aminopeptidase N